MNEDTNDDNDRDETADADLAFAEVTVMGPGVSITRRVDEATMGSIIGLLFGVAAAGRGAVSGGGSGGGGGQSAGGRGGPLHSSSQWDDDITLGEFISATGATTFQQKICAAGYYLMKIRGADSFTSSDVKTALADAHEDMPGNFSRDFGDAASKNYIAKQHGGEAGHFIVPKTGRTAVESNFTDLPPRRRARKTTKRASQGSNGGSA